MKLAFTTLACPDWTLEQAVDAAQRFGYGGIEMRLLDSEVITPTIDAAARERVKRVCAAANLPIVCLDTSVRVAQPDAQARAAQVKDGLAMLELASDWESPYIRVFGSPPEGTDDVAAIEGAVAVMEPLAKRGAELGIGVALETHDAFAAGSTVAQVLNQLSTDGAGALWDTLHPFRVREPLDTTLEVLANRILHVHIKDGRRPDDGGEKWPLTLLGEGDVPMPEILQALKNAGYNGWLSVEWEKKWHPYLAEPEIALKQHVEVLRKYLAELA